MTVVSVRGVCSAFVFVVVSVVALVVLRMWADYRGHDRYGAAIEHDLMVLHQGYIEFEKREGRPPASFEELGADVFRGLLEFPLETYEILPFEAHYRPILTTNAEETATRGGGGIRRDGSFTNASPGKKADGEEEVR